MKKIIYKFLIFFALYIFTFNCNTPQGSGGGGGGGSGGDGDGGNSGNGNGNTNNDTITGLQAYILQSPNHIRLDWEMVDNSNYNIYRYKLQSDAIPDLIIQNHTTNEYEDNTAINNTPYYYKVSSVKNGTEGDLSNFVFGLKSNVIDGFENNNNLSDFQNNDPGLPLGGYDAIIYSCKKNNIDGIETDTDWYKYRGKAEYFEVIVTLGDTGFDNDDIKLQFRYESSDNNIIVRNSSINDNASTTCGFGNNVGDYDNDAGNDPVNVYFKIYVDGNNVDKTNNIIENYHFEISYF